MLPSLHPTWLPLTRHIHPEPACYCERLFITTNEGLWSCISSTWPLQHSSSTGFTIIVLAHLSLEMVLAVLLNSMVWIISQPLYMLLYTRRCLPEHSWLTSLDGRCILNNRCVCLLYESAIFSTNRNYRKLSSS